MENQLIEKIVLTGTEVKYGKSSFVAFNAKINDKYYKIKFVRTCNDIPLSAGTYEIEVDLKDLSPEFGTYKDKEGNEKPYAILWVRHLHSIKKVDLTDVMRERDLELVKGIFNK